ncbi:MAG TPA: c-type cytochrome [Gemmatimonadaceae bacterium]|nr:c-type cytochrome [Gemmatimonadaceae bacterium]
MTKRHTRMFFIGGTLLFTLIFLVLTVDSHRQFGELTNADQITGEVEAGKHVWHRKNCINCHTLFGEGAYYAPDLTKITQQRGEAYLRAFLQDPSRFYSEEVHRRLMPNPNLSEDEITQVIAFLDWVSNVDNQGWPPRPILVSGGELRGAAAVPEPGAAASDDPTALGEVVFRQTPPACFACHSTAAGVALAGPSLAGLATRAAALVDSASYTGAADDAAGYIRESIVAPHAHLVPGAIYGAGGRSFMPDNYSEMLTSDQIDQLIAYLLTLR